MTREIVVNGRFLSRQVTGVERYGREIMSLIGSRCRVEKTRANGLAGHMWEQFILPTRLNSRSVLWSPANSGPLMIRNQVLTIHDLSPLEHPEWFQKRFAGWYRLFLPILARCVHTVIVPSTYVQRKVMKRFNITNVAVVPNGVNTSHFCPHAQQDMLQLPERFILFVGSLQPRKNLSMLLDAWNEIRDDYAGLWLLVAGDAGSVYNKIELRANERVQFLGYVTEDILPGLYANATLLVLPSFDEGFGLPVLEAMACGTPVIASNGGALPEVVGNAGLIFQLSYPGSLSTLIRECLENRNLYSSLVTNGLEHVKTFSWQTSAELIWKTLNEI